MRRAHPRPCGEHDPSTAEMKEIRGSSLPVRGARQDPLCGGALRGLIPACAGSTNREGVIVVIHGAHPRSRREHTSGLLRAAAPVGSSPLARGTPPGYRRKRPVPGLIPARAGNTVGVDTIQGRPRAHPRSRGEHRHSAALPRCAPGSSPLARGTLAQVYQIPPGMGLIPARAGNT